MLSRSVEDSKALLKRNAVALPTKPAFIGIGDYSASTGVARSFAGYVKVLNGSCLSRLTEEGAVSLGSPADFCGFVLAPASWDAWQRCNGARGRTIIKPWGDDSLDHIHDDTLAVR